MSPNIEWGGPNFERYSVEADLREARAEISRHRELIKQMKAGVELMYEFIVKKRTDLHPEWVEVGGFMEWYHRNVG